MKNSRGYWSRNCIATIWLVDASPHYEAPALRGGFGAQYLRRMRYRTHIGHKVLAVALAIGLLGWVVRAII